MTVPWPHICSQDGNGSQMLSCWVGSLLSKLHSWYFARQKGWGIINSLKNQSKITINMFVLWDLQTSIQIWTVSHTLWSFGEKIPGRQGSGRWNQLESVSWRFNIQRQSRLWYVPEKGKPIKNGLYYLYYINLHTTNPGNSLCVIGLPLLKNTSHSELVDQSSSTLERLRRWVRNLMIWIPAACMLVNLGSAVFINETAASPNVNMVWYLGFLF